MMHRLRRLNQAGDTIVEVLIVLAVLGLALSIAYATANRGLQQSRNAQEHSEALGIINSQVELLRSAFAKQDGAAIETQGGSGPFCLSTSGTNIAITPLANSGANQFNENVASDKLGNTVTYPAPCIQNTLYNVSVVGRGGGVYDFRVRWEGLGNLGRQQEEITYKIGNVTAAATGGYFDQDHPPPPEPTSLDLSFTTSSNSVSRGEQFRLDWATTPAAAACTASGDWSGSKGASGTTNITVPATTSATSLTYTLTCTLGALPPATGTITVNIRPYEPTLAILYRTFWSNISNFTFYNFFAQGDHLYSTSSTEGISCCGYRAEGNVGSVDTVQGPGEVPLYRLYSGPAGDHFYTTSSAEADYAVTLGYGREGITGYVKPLNSNGTCPSGTQPLYRTNSSYLGDHFYTTNFNEYSTGYDDYWGNPPWPFAKFAWYNYPEGIAACTFNNAGT